MTKGMIHLYTGNGKGKTTAAIGAAIRARGAGKQVFFTQFVKGMHYSELSILQSISGITVRQYGRECFIVHTPSRDDIEKAREGLAEVATVLKEGSYDMVILDEACIALYYKLFSLEEMITAINARRPHIEIIVTGRYAPQELIDYADLVTEMREIKHYYTKGVTARDGIEK